MSSPIWYSSMQIWHCLLASTATDGLFSCVLVMDLKEDASVLKRDSSESDCSIFSLPSSISTLSFVSKQR
jgi:hypothetical protein